MNEYDLMIKWFPDSLDAARALRLKYDHGRFVNCRHYKKTTDRKFYCVKKAVERVNCHGCRVCPNCNGTLAFYKRHTSYGQDGTYYREANTCVQCGAYIEQELFKPKSQQRKKEKRSGKCQVDGCNCTAYEGREYTESSRDWIICETHSRQIKTWRFNNEKGEEQRPLIVENGKLYENPAYRKKQGKKGQNVR